MKPANAIIVGAGIGGIATAIRLAIKGHDVVVYEKNEVAGGKMYVIEKEGYRFDAGPSLFTQPTNIEALFELAGERISDYFSYDAVPIANRYFFENGKTINAYTRADLFAKEMADQVGEPAEHILNYLKGAEQVYEKVGTIFLNYSLHRSSTWLHPRILDAMRAIRLPYLFNTLDGFNRASFSTPEAVQLFNRFATYNGSNPYSAPGMLSLIPHLEQNQGTFYPHGGMVSIPNALVRLAKKVGVRFMLNTAVESIEVQDRKATGIRVDGQVVPADLVVSNVDAYYTYKRLLSDASGAQKILRNERSSSAFIFYWGIKKEFKELHLHNIFFTKDYQQEFDHLFRLKTYCDDPTIYVNITAKMETGHAPEGKENWFVMVNAPAVVDADWSVVTNRLRTHVINKLSRMLGTDLGQYIEVEEILSPAGIQRKTDSYMGSLYGTSSNSKWAAFLRHANFTSNINGLYFTGGSVHPGGGIPLCLQSAKIVSELIEEGK